MRIRWQRLVLTLIALQFLPAWVAASNDTPQAAPAWTEKRLLMGALRWWVDPARVEALRALTPGALAVQVDWALPPDADADLTDAERDALRLAKVTALSGASDAATPAFRAEVRVTEAWRPYRFLNVLIVALPGPGAPFVTQGGAAIEVVVRDAVDGRPVAGFGCRSYAGIARFVDAFGRIGHARGALQDCAAHLLATLAAGRLPDVTFGVARDATVIAPAPGGDPVNTH